MFTITFNQIHFTSCIMIDRYDSLKFETSRNGTLYLITLITTIGQKSKFSTKIALLFEVSHSTLKIV